ncbi:MAG: DUF3037 domain-containing protein [Syntrophorhabdales bacterium]|jgi:hypothetical protein
MKTAYSFVVLRYVHDVMTGEFVNVGVALYAPEAGYIGGLCNTRYGRVNSMFHEIDGEYFRGLMRYIQERFEDLGYRLRTELPMFEAPADILTIAKSILPTDDSSLQWSDPGGGQTENPAKALKDIFERFVARYDVRLQQQTRDDSEVWRVFKTELEVKHVLSRLQPKRIVSNNYDYEFQHSWKNQDWHVYEPVSFDLQEADSILDKANRWLGRITTLRDSPDKFKLHMLLGEPSLDKHRSTFIKAENILNKIPGDKEFVPEHKAKSFLRLWRAQSCRILKSNRPGTNKQHCQGVHRLPSSGYSRQNTEIAGAQAFSVLSPIECSEW